MEDPRQRSTTRRGAQSSPFYSSVLGATAIQSDNYGRIWLSAFIKATGDDRFDATSYDSYNAVSDS
jgi:hypothetical protein